MAFSPNVSVWATDSDTAGSAVAVVVGVERAGETRGRSAGVRVRDTDRLHRRERESEWGVQRAFYDSIGENSFMFVLAYSVVGGRNPP